MTNQKVAKLLNQSIKEIEERVTKLVSIELLKKTESGFRTMTIKQVLIG